MFENLHYLKKKCSTDIQQMMKPRGFYVFFYLQNMLMFN